MASSYPRIPFKNSTPDLIEQYSFCKPGSGGRRSAGQKKSKKSEIPVTAVLGLFLKRVLLFHFSSSLFVIQVLEGEGFGQSHLGTKKALDQTGPRA